MRYPLDPKMVLEPHSRNPSALGDELQKSKIVTHHFVIKHGSGKSMNRWYVSLFIPFPDDVSINNAIYIFCLAIFLQDFPHGNSPWLFHRMSEVHEWDEVGLTEMFRRNHGNGILAYGNTMNYSWNIANKADKWWLVDDYKRLYYPIYGEYTLW